VVRRKEATSGDRSGGAGQRVQVGRVNGEEGGSTGRYWKLLRRSMPSPRVTGADRAKNSTREAKKSVVLKGERDEPLVVGRAFGRETRRSARLTVRVRRNRDNVWRQQGQCNRGEVERRVGRSGKKNAFPIREKIQQGRKTKWQREKRKRKGGGARTSTVSGGRARSIGGV